MTTSSSTTTRPNRPSRDPDPDYDELWVLAGKLSAMLDAVRAAGHSVSAALLGADTTDEVVSSLNLTRREVSIMTMVDRRPVGSGATAETHGRVPVVAAFLAGFEGGASA